MRAAMADGVLRSGTGGRPGRGGWVSGVWLYLAYPLQPTAPTDQTSQPAGRVFGDIFIDERAMRHKKNTDRDHARVVGRSGGKPGVVRDFRGDIRGNFRGPGVCRGWVARGDRAGTLSGL